MQDAKHGAQAHKLCIFCGSRILFRQTRENPITGKIERHPLGKAWPIHLDHSCTKKSSTPRRAKHKGRRKKNGGGDGQGLLGL